MPMIKLLLRETFPKAKHYVDDYPINTVAVGAASYASTIKNEEEEIAAESSGSNFVKERVIQDDVEVDAVGIDLGTTRCCVAVNRPTGIETIGLENEGNRLLPSYVAYDEKHEKYGKIVIHRMRDHSKSTAFDAKRLLGKEFNEIKIDENWTFTVISFGNKVKLQLTTHEGETLKYPEEISTSLLKHMKEKTEQFQTKELSEVVITIPTAFNKKQKQSTHVAAILAGWKKVHLISESVAAALAYSIQNPLLSSNSQDGILVFDLGGGTLDVCVFKYKNESVEIIGRSGDPNLGGRDFDKLLIDYFAKRLKFDFKIDVPESKKYFLISKSQEIKESLSNVEEDR
uniref:Uncharacterized protein n=1 Tax=Panagrolaimus davidi TaxID=227884 RepID=A0A914QLX6_9BILA